MTLAIPPVFVEAEAAVPAKDAFRNRPAEAIVVGDAVMLHGRAWRVKGRRTRRASPRITFTLYPIDGGRPHSAELFPRQWLPVLAKEAK